MEKFSFFNFDFNLQTHHMESFIELLNIINDHEVVRLFVEYIGLSSIALLVSFILGIIVSIIANKKLINNNNNFLPYRWGYYNSFVRTFFSIIYILINCFILFKFLNIDKEEYNNHMFFEYELSSQIVIGFILFSTMLSLISAFIGIYIWKRKKWAFIVGTILIPDIIIWIINFLYIKNRSKELT